jgi:hypothetical protein
MDILKIPALLCLVAIVLAGAARGAVLRNGDFAQLDAQGAPENWKVTSFHGNRQPQLNVVTTAGRHEIAFLFSEDGAYQSSFFQKLPTFDTLPEFDQNGELIVTFDYKCETADRGWVSVSLSGGPGCESPALRNAPVWEPDGKWHPLSTRFPLAGLTAKEMVFEFILEREFKAGDKFSIASLQAEIVCPLPLVEFNPVNPVSGVVFTDMPSQKVAGLLKAARVYAGYQVRLVLAGAAAPDPPLATQEVEVAYPVTRWEFDLTSAPEGKYTLSAELLSKEKKVIKDKKMVLWRLQPTATTSRVVDGRVYYGSKPIVLLGTYHVSDWAVGVTNTENQRLGIPLLTREQMLAGLSGQGFNSFFFTNGIPPADFLEAARTQRLSVIPSVAGVGRDWGGAPLVEQAAAVQDDPRIFGWYGCDEPTAGESAKKAVAVYADLKSASPHKLVVSSFFAWSDYFNGESTPADLILLDIYRVTRPDADLSEVGTQVKSAVAYAQKHGNIAIGVAPQAFIFMGPEPTPEQLRAQFYLGLVNGARAFFPYAYIASYDVPFTQYAGAPAGMSLNPLRNRWFLPDSKMWLILPDLFREMAALEDLILADGRGLNVTSGNPAIQFMAKRVEKRSCLIAVNPRATPLESTFAFAAPVGAVTPLLGTSAATPQGEKLPLEFKGYEVKVFQLELGD